MSDTILNFVGAGAGSQPSVDAVLDVVFLHGLTGDRYDTWGGPQNSSFWPAWLAADYPKVNFYTAGYDSSLFASAFAGEGPSLIDHSTMLLDGLVSRPVTAPKIIFITHSLGGLIIKQMLRKCSDAADEGRKRFLDRVGCVIFLGTPHQGAGAAAALNAILCKLLSKSVKQLAYGEEHLLDLIEWFRNWAVEASLTVRAYYETEKTKGFTIVDKVSSNPYVHGCDPIAVHADHIRICKPASRQSPLYQSVSALLQQLSVAPLSKFPLNLNGRTALAELGQNGDDVQLALDSETLVDYQNFTTIAPDDRRSLGDKLRAAGRGYQVRDAEAKKERFNMTLQRHIAQPSAIAKYTRLMADLETRFNRHARRSIARGADLETIDHVIQNEVIDPVARTHNESTATLVESALYYLTGNCHLRLDNVDD